MTTKSAADAIRRTFSPARTPLAQARRIAGTAIRPTQKVAGKYLPCAGVIIARFVGSDGILPVRLCYFLFYESKRIDGGIAADEHAVPSAVVGEANAVASRHNRPALDVVGLAGDEGVKRGMVVAGADVRAPVAELA
jgi:hypothetical protein